jgi:hypothetical protein
VLHSPCRPLSCNGAAGVLFGSPIVGLAFRTLIGGVYASNCSH